MAVATNTRHFIHFSRFFFEITDEEHLVVVVQERITIFVRRQRDDVYVLRIRNADIVYILSLLLLSAHIVSQIFSNYTMLESNRGSNTSIWTACRNTPMRLFFCL